MRLWDSSENDVLYDDGAGLIQSSRPHCGYVNCLQSWGYQDLDCSFIAVDEGVKAFVYEAVETNLSGDEWLEVDFA